MMKDNKILVRTVLVAMFVGAGFIVSACSTSSNKAQIYAVDIEISDPF